MEEQSVVVKQNPIMVRVLLILTSLMFSGLGIASLIMAENNDHLWIAFWFFVVAVVCLFFAITAKLYIKAKDIYTKTGMVRKRGDKVLYELEWQNVEKIQYYKFSLNSLLMFGPTALMFGPTAFFIFQKEPPKDKKQAKNFLTYYSMKEVKKIQTIIPLEILY